MDLSTEFEVSRFYYFAGKDFASVLKSAYKIDFKMSMTTRMLGENRILTYIYNFTSDTGDIIILSVIPNINHTTLDYYKVKDVVLTNNELKDIDLPDVKKFFDYDLKKYINNSKKKVNTRNVHGRVHKRAVESLHRTIEIINKLKVTGYVPYKEK